MTASKDDLLTSAQLARLLGTSPGHIVRWAKDGVIPFVWTTGTRSRERRYSLLEVAAALADSPALWNEDAAIAPGMPSP